MADIDRVSEQHAAATRRVLIGLEDVDEAAKAARRRMGDQAYAEHMAWERDQQEAQAARQELPADRAAREQREEHERLLRAAAERAALRKAQERTVQPTDWTDDDENGYLPKTWLV